MTATIYPPHAASSAAISGLDHPKHGLVTAQLALTPSRFPRLTPRVAKSGLTLAFYAEPLRDSEAHPSLWLVTVSPDYYIEVHPPETGK